jgi:hypothetical protein
VCVLFDGILNILLNELTPATAGETDTKLVSTYQIESHGHVQLAWLWWKVAKEDLQLELKDSETSRTSFGAE